MARARILLRPPEAADLRDFTSAARRSVTLHHPWTTAPVTAAQFRTYLARMSQPGQCARLVCHRDSGELLGVVNLTQIVMGLFRSGYVGYYAFAGHERQGHMREGLNAMARLAFGTLKLHRLEANLQPGNTASRALVRACGFQQEGYSPRYLKIGGRWRDHERWALLAS